MQAKILFNSAVFALLISSAFAVDTGTNVLRLRDTDGDLHVVDSQNRDISVMRPQDRLEAIAQMETQLGNSDYNASEGAKEVLLYLSDPKAIKYFVDKMREGIAEGSRALEAYGREPVLSYLIADVDHGSVSVSYGEEMTHVPSRLGATRAALLIIKRSTELPAEARAWAGDRVDTLNGSIYGTLDQVANQVSQWWSHNKEAILEKRFGEATWIPKEEINVNVLNGVIRPPPPPPLPILSPSAHSPDTVSSFKKRENYWLYIVLGLLFITITLLVWKKRGKR